MGEGQPESFPAPKGEGPCGSPRQALPCSTLCSLKPCPRSALGPGGSVRLRVPETAVFIEPPAVSRPRTLTQTPPRGRGGKPSLGRWKKVHTGPWGGPLVGQTRPAAAGELGSLAHLVPAAAPKASVTDRPGLRSPCPASLRLSLCQGVGFRPGPSTGLALETSGATRALLWPFCSV